jgi:hypothetical protein
MAIVSVAIIVNFHLKSEPSAVGTYAFCSHSKGLYYSCKLHDASKVITGCGRDPKCLKTVMTDKVRTCVFDLLTVVI